MLKRFTDLVNSYAQNSASDLHICGGQPIIYRKDGSIKSENKISWSHQDVDNLIKSILNAKNMTMRPIAVNPLVWEAMGYKTIIKKAA